MWSKISTIRSKIAFHLLRKPRHCLLEGQRNTYFKKGILCISIDFELAWAWRYAYKQKRDWHILPIQERENVPKILKKLDELNVPVTWAIVGHLFLERCKKSNGIVHPDMPRPKYFKNEYWEFNRGDWYDLDPGADFLSAPAWYAPDLIREIQNSRVPHEIACHSFSHIGFNEKYCTKELAEAELNKCANVMAKFRVKPVSMVFPGDEAGHFDILFRYGYRYIRYFPKRNVEISVPVKLDEGLWAIISSSNIVPDESWDSNYILLRLKKYLDKVMKKKALCHFWFHPSISEKRISEILFPILDYSIQKREKGELEIMTMDGVGKLMDSMHDPA